MTLYSRSGEDIDRGLIGYWKLDDKKSGSSIAIDRTKFNDAVLTGTTNTEGVNGLNTDAMLFNGTTDDVTIALAPNPKTIAVWVNISPRGDGQMYPIYASNCDYALNRGIGFVIVDDLDATEANKLRLFMGNTFDTADTSIVHNTWTHIAVVIGDTQSKFYIDGKYDCTIALTYDPYTPGASTIGSATFKGALQNARTYDRQLTDGEISKLYRLKL